MKLKILSLLVAMLAIVCLLASCNGNKDNTGDGNNNNNSDVGNNNTDVAGEYYWGNSEILVELYENTNSGELSSGLRRYYAGTDQTANSEIDGLIKIRNDNAQKTTGVKPIYHYNDKYSWGASFAEIQRLVSSGDSSAPDIFCNFAYDLTSLALRGCFANLYSNTYDYLQSYGKGQNYFTFTEEGYVGVGETYFDSEAGQGYFYDYMQSLSFVNSNGVYDKMYCLASNYCIDLVRAFLVVPVNVQMMNSISLQDSTGDKDGDGDFDVEDFYALVWEYGWTYDVLAQYCNAVFVDNGDVPGVADINDDLGAAFGRSSGLTGSGFLYTTSVKIINKVNNNGQHYYEYLPTNTDLINFAGALEKLFSPEKSPTGAVGITSVSKSDVINAGLGDDGSQGELVGIRQQFSKNKMLFGGIIAVGSLEEDDYQGMSENGKGFGIVPVPLYRSGDEYLTLVHNIARVVAISATTTEFEQCSAFLDYQSTHSQEILDEYYTQELAAKTSQGLAGKQNNKMLTYIRNHVRDCFDKTYEDVISSYLKSNGDTEAEANRWHQLLMTNKYMYSGINGAYESHYRTKNAELKGNNPDGSIGGILKVWYDLSIKR